MEVGERNLHEAKGAVEVEELQDRSYEENEHDHPCLESTKL